MCFVELARIVGVALPGPSAVPGEVGELLARIPPDRHGVVLQLLRSLVDLAALPPLPPDATIVERTARGMRERELMPKKG